MMKKIFWIALILCLITPLCVYAVDGGDFDSDNDGDVDAADLAGFADHFGKFCWYKDADGDGYSDGTKVWAESRPADHYLAGELTVPWGDTDDGNAGVVPVYNGDYSISNCADVQALIGYVEVTGNLYINPGSDIHLNGLESLHSIGGLLNIGTALTSLSGLNNLTSVAGDLEIEPFSNLPSLSGLDNLTSVGGKLWIILNDSLTSLSGLESLVSVGGGLDISDIVALTSLSGLESLASVGGTLWIGGNDVLTSLSGLNNLTSVAGDLRITFNATLTDLGLNSLCEVTNQFNIYNNINLCTNLAEDLRDQVIVCPEGGIGGTIRIENNKSCP